MLRRNATALPDAPAVTDSGATLTWRHFARRVEGFAAQLAACGVRPGGRVALMLPNGIDYLTAIFALARCGAMAAHINTRFGIVEVGDVLARTGASLIVTRGDFAAVDFLARLAGIPPEQLGGLRAIIASGVAPLDAVNGIPVLPFDTAGASDDVGSPDDPCLSFTTGGTTARPKLVMHRQRSIARHAGDVMRHLGFDAPGAALLAAVPFCGAFGNAAAMAAVAGGAHIVCMDAFDAVVADGLIRRHRISHAVGDDRMVGRLADVALDGAGPHDTLRFFGTAPFHPDAEAAYRRGVAAGLRPHAIYGSSEVQALFAIGHADAGGWGAVWPVSADVRVSLIEDPASREPGAIAEMAIAAPSLFDFYLDDPAATDAVRRPDGSFRTGDLAELVDGGFVFHGRRDDRLRLGGFLVSPLEIEGFLQTQPGVAAAQVVAVAHAGGSAPFAFVVAAPGVAVDEAALVRSCRANLARYKVPVRVEAIAAFPVSNGPNGPKISRAELRLRAARIMSDGATA